MFSFIVVTAGACGEGPPPPASATWPDYRGQLPDWVTRIEAQIEGKAYQLAITELHALVAADSANTIARHSLAWVLARAARNEEALQVSRAGARNDPLDASFQYQISSLLSLQGQHAQAEQHSHEASRLGWWFSDAASQYAAVLFEIGLREESIRLLEQAGESEDAAPNIQGQLVATVLRDSELSDAIDYFEKSLRDAPRNYALHYGLGHGLRMQQRYPEAIVHLRESVLLLPGQSKTHFELALALFGDDRTEKALASARIALQLEPENDAYRSYVKDLEQRAR